MKKYFLIIVFCSLFLCCKSGLEEPEKPENPGEDIEEIEKPVEEPGLAPCVIPSVYYELTCGCGEEWPQDVVPFDRKLSWDYPVKPWTEEWNNLTTRQERIDAMQIPNDILMSLYTDELVELCMTNSFIYEISHYLPVDNGLDSLLNRINCFRELYNREDASKALLNWYKNAMQNVSFLYSDASPAQKGIFLENIAIIEILLTRYQSQNEVNKDDYIEIVQQLVCGYKKMLLHPDYFDEYSLDYNIFSRARQLVKISDQNLEKIPQKDKNQVLIGAYGPYHYDEQSISIINELSCQYIK